MTDAMQRRFDVLPRISFRPSGHAGAVPSTDYGARTASRARRRPAQTKSERIAKLEQRVQILLLKRGIDPAPLLADGDSNSSAGPSSDSVSS